MHHHGHSDQPEGPRERLEPLVRIGDPAEANILAAMLRSEGIPVRLHGESFGPYPVAIGELAEVEIWVGADHMTAARTVLESYTV
jgi:hypothetical protein